MVSFFDSLLSIILVPLLIPYFMISFRWLLPFCLMVLLAACSSEPPYVPAAEREKKGSGDQNQGEKPSEEENGNSGSNGSNGSNGNDAAVVVVTAEVDAVMVVVMKTTVDADIATNPI